MFPARPTPRSSRRAVAAARSDPPRTVAETHVPCPRFQARGFKPEVSSRRHNLPVAHCVPATRRRYRDRTPKLQRLRIRRNLATERLAEYAVVPPCSAFRPHAAGPETALRRYSASVTVSRPYTAGTGLRSRNHARAATIAHRIATGPNPLRQQHAGIATSLRILRNPPQATQRNHPAPHRSVSPLRTATRHACFRASSDNHRHPDFPLLSGKPYHIGSRIGTDTPISESLRITAITPALGSEQSLRFSHLAERKPASCRHPIGTGHRPAEAPEYTQPGLLLPGHPAAASRDIRPLLPETPGRSPDSSPGFAPEDDLPSDGIRRRAATHEKNGRSNMPANRRSAENRSPASLRDVPRPPRKTAELGKYAKCVRFVSDFGNFR